MVCAMSNTFHEDACTGDSGGPLFDWFSYDSSSNIGATEEVVGLVSWGNGCGTHPGISLILTLKYFMALALNLLIDNSQIRTVTVCSSYGGLMNMLAKNMVLKRVRQITRSLICGHEENFLHVLKGQFWSYEPD